MLFSEYRNNSRLSQSQLKHILYGEDEFIYQLNKPSETSDAQNLGSAVHLLLLQPHLSDHLLKLEKPAGNTRLGKAFKYLSTNSFDENFLEFYKEEIKELQDKYSSYFKNPSEYIVVNTEEYDKASYICDSILKNTDAYSLINRCYAFEIPRFYNYKGIELKAQLDALGSNIVVDLKTTRILNNERIIRNQIYSYNYHFQAASYLIADGTDCYETSYFIIFARTEPPYSVFPVQLSIKTLEYGRDLFNEACDLYNNLKLNSFKPQSRIKVV